MTDIKVVDILDLDEEDFDTVLAADIHFSGSISFTEPFMIKGSVNGSIQSDSDLLIDTDAVVIADISARRVAVKGRVEGNICAQQLVHVVATGSVKGDITAVQVVLENGCFFSGKCAMRESVPSVTI